MPDDQLTAINPALLIALSAANNAQRNAVQAIVKAHSESWWHERPDLWIVEGHDPVYWRDLIKPVLGLSPATVSVLTLPSPGLRGWAMSNLPRAQSKWLFETYAGKPQPPPPAPAPEIPVGKLPAADDDIPL
jgi:hypothetical protein